MSKLRIAPVNKLKDRSEGSQVGMGSAASGDRIITFVLSDQNRVPNEALNIQSD